MNNIPLVTLVMPTMNCVDFLSDTIDSVLCQTLNDFEFIIVDDNSTDGTRELLKKYAEKDARIIIEDGDQKGIGGALNKGCLLSKAEYIARIDADDICMPERLEKEVEYLNNHPDVVLVAADYYVMNEEGKCEGRNYSCTSNRVIKKMLRRNLNPLAHPTCMFRKNVYLKTKGYPLTPTHEDLILWKSMIQYGKIGVINKPLIRYRMMGSTLSKKFRGNPYEAILKSFVNKIICEEGQNAQDVVLYKKVMKIASTCILPGHYSKEVTKGEYIHRVLRRYIPESLLNFIIVNMKNVFLYFRYSCWR